MADPPSFLDLLYDDAPRAAFDDLVAQAEAAGRPAAEVTGLRHQHEVALRLRELIARQRSREAELSALYETASDLTAIRDVDAILAAIVRRARQLLHADMTYLSLNDEHEGASYMKVTDGALTREFQSLRLPLGTGLLGLVAQTGAPYFTEDYQADERFVHRGYIDEAVAGERIRAILGVPLVLEGRVIGALLAVHRSVRRFPPAEVSLLTSFAAHATVAMENARLFAELDQANRTMSEHSAAVERAALAHDRLTDLLLHGGGVEEVSGVLADVLGGEVGVHEPDGGLRAGTPAPSGWVAAVPEALASGRSVRSAAGYVATAVAGSDHLATLVRHGDHEELGLAERRTLERGALVTALVLLFARSVAETEERLGGELLADLLEGRERDETGLRERGRRRGVALEAPMAVAVADIGGLDRFAAVRAAARLAARHRGLAGEHRGAVVVLATGGPLDLGRELAAVVAAAGGTATVGVAVADPLALRSGHDDARRCLDTLVTLGRHGEVADPAELGLARLLLGDNGPDQLAEFLSGTLGPVVDYDAGRGTGLVGTLEAWFAAGGRVKDTADRLHVHPNTVVQRLARVTDLLGDDWREPDRALDLQLALRILRLGAQ